MKGKRGERKNKMERIMKLWAKISSLVIVGYLIHSIYITSQIFLLPGKASFWIYLTPFFWIGGILFYFPLFYYGWVKNPKNEEMKSWAKTLTIFLPVLVLIGFISPWGLDFPKDIPFTLPSFALLGPLYYYAWRKKKK